jgi:hypothetical protein
MGLGEMGCCGARKATAADMWRTDVQLAAKKRVEAMCGWCLEYTQVREPVHDAHLLRAVHPSDATRPVCLA